MCLTKMHQQLLVISGADIRMGKETHQLVAVHTACVLEQLGQLGPRRLRFLLTD